MLNLLHSHNITSGMTEIFEETRAWKFALGVLIVHLHMHSISQQISSRDNFMTTVQCSLSCHGWLMAIRSKPSSEVQSLRREMLRSFMKPSAGVNSQQEGRRCSRCVWMTWPMGWKEGPFHGHSCSCGQLKILQLYSVTMPLCSGMTSSWMLVCHFPSFDQRLESLPLHYS